MNLSSVIRRVTSRHMVGSVAFRHTLSPNQTGLYCLLHKPRLHTTSCHARTYQPLRYTSSTSSTNDDNDGSQQEPLQESAEKTGSGEDADVRTLILDHALNFVVEYGWSREALAYGAEAAGYAGVAEGLFKGGGHELAAYFLHICNARLEEFLKTEATEIENSNEKHQVSNFVGKAIEFRLRMIIPYISVWPEAMSVLLHPAMAATSFDELSRMVDNIWYYAGDKSSDFSWYTKRGILAKLYVSTEMVMLTDQSPDFQDTWDFLERRIKDIGNLEKVSATAQRTGEQLAQVSFAGLGVLRNVLGFGDMKR